MHPAEARRRTSRVCCRRLRVDPKPRDRAWVGRGRCVRRGRRVPRTSDEDDRDEQHDLCDATRHLLSVTSGAQYEPVQESALARKLKLEPGARYRILNAPAGYLHKPADGAEGAADIVLLFASNRAELETNVAAALEALKPGCS